MKWGLYIPKKHNQKLHVSMSFCFQNQLYVCWHKGKEQKFVKGLVNLNMNVPEGEFYILPF